MILVLGKTGQVGSALTQALGASAMSVDLQEINLAQPDFTDKLTALLEQHEFTTLINAAAYTQVDKAEDEPALAMRINGVAVGELATWCKKHDVRLVHYSTDYVFDGSGSHPRKEEEISLPINHYGKSKLLGEQLIADSGAEHFIFRTSWVYDAKGINFFNTMRRLFREREEISVVADQIGAPTYAPHIAKATLDALEEAQRQAKFPSGVYHLCGGGEVSWYRFAQAILSLATTYESGIKCKSINPITSADYPTKAKRPLNSRLDCSKAKKQLNVALPKWEIGLKECYEGIRL